MGRHTVETWLRNVSSQLPLVVRVTYQKGCFPLNKTLLMCVEPGQEKIVETPAACQILTLTVWQESDQEREGFVSFGTVAGCCVSFDQRSDGVLEARSNNL